jgi:hypothetical protein
MAWKDSKSILNGNTRDKGTTPTCRLLLYVLWLFLIDWYRHHIVGKKKKTTIEKESRAKCCDNKKLIWMEMEYEFAWLLFRSLSFLFVSRMYNSSICRWITHERCFRAHTRRNRNNKKKEVKIGRCTASTIMFFFVLKKIEIIQWMDKVEYVDWPTQKKKRKIKIETKRNKL